MSNHLSYDFQRTFSKRFASTRQGYRILLGYFRLREASHASRDLRRRGCKSCETIRGPRLIERITRRLSSLIELEVVLVEC